MVDSDLRFKVKDKLRIKVDYDVQVLVLKYILGYTISNGLKL